MGKNIKQGDFVEIKRDSYLNKLKVRQNNGLIKIITGIRRCGKSYLMNTIFYNYLLESGVDKDRIIRFAFDSASDLRKIGEDLIDIDLADRKVDPYKFAEYIDSQLGAEGNYYLLLDEVQKLNSFEAVLNGYLRYDNIDIYVTGSNSRFLSSDILTEFAGRGDEIHVMPLSFSEFYSCYDGSAEEAFDDYMVWGGLPALVGMVTEEQKAAYLKTQLRNVYLRDIEQRYGLRNDNNMGELLDVLASGISSLTNPKKLSDTFRSVKGTALAASTIDKYVSFFEDAFLVSKAKRYDVKGRRYIDTPYKIYFEDTGLRNARLDFRQTEPTHIMENIIYNELRRRDFKVDVGIVEVREKDENSKQIRRQLEIDFVANMGSKRYYIQSAYDIPDEEKRRQETRSFDNTNDSFKKIIIIGRSAKPRYDEKGYVTMGIREFLLNDNSLDY